MDMRPQYREELSRLNKSERKLKRDLRLHHSKVRREIKLLERSRDQALRRVSKELDRIDRRRSILNGRLS